MDQHRFDDLTRSFARGISRRQLLRGFGAALATLGVSRTSARASRPSQRDCASFCREVFPPGRERGQCISDAAAGTGPCIACGGHPDRYCDGACVDLATDPGHCGACGVACDSGGACLTAGTCENGTCAPGGPVDCSALDGACTVGVCNPDTGACEAQSANEGGACQGDNLCETYTCQSGTCTSAGTKDCSYLDGQCSTGMCDPDTGVCVTVAKNTGEACESGDACTTNTTCQSDGTCGGGEDVICNDPPECRELPGICDGSDGGCSYAAVGDGQACRDGAGRCAGGTCHDCLSEGSRVCGAPWLCCSNICNNDPDNFGCCICA